MPSIKTQDLYRVVITEAAGIAASGDVDFTVSVAPARTNGFLVLSPENATSREVVYFHNVIGNRIYVRGVNRRSPKLHPANDSVQMNDVEDIFNYYSDMVSPLFYMEKTGTLDVRVWGGTVLVNRAQITIADTNLTLTDNMTNYIVYDYLTNIISANTTGVGLVKVTVTVTSGIIGTPTYNVIKESYADPFVPDVTLVAPVIQNNAFAYAVSTGSANAYLVSYTPAPVAYADGQKFFFKANFQNTGAATVNVNGLGAKSIKKLDGVTDLASTDIASGAMVEIMYDGTNFQLTSIPQTIKNNDVTQLTSVNLLASKTTPVAADKLLIGDSDASFVNKNITLGNLFSFFGDGSDGSITISTNTTLTRDMYYINLTINNTIVLNPNGFRIYVSGTLTNNGIISRDGNAGQNGILNNVQVVLSASGGAALNIGNLGGSIAGGASDIAGSNQSPTYISQSGANGGRSHNSATTPLGGISTIGAQRDLVISPYNISFIGHIASNGFTRYVASAGSAGGLSEGNGTLGKAVSGGGGGGTGGPIYIAANIVNNSSGIIRSNGGTGGNGISSSTNTSPFIASGGGGGGAGGPIIIIYKSISVGTIQSNGGLGGIKTPGLQNGSAILSTDGAVGPNGFILQYQVV